MNFLEVMLELGLIFKIEAKGLFRYKNISQVMFQLSTTLTVLSVLSTNITKTLCKKPLRSTSFTIEVLK